jgi:Fe-S-cluster-containing hydrogenase component 2
MKLDIISSSLVTESCNECDGACLVSCFNDAITYEQAHGYRVIEDNCAGCGACIPACDPGFISLEAGVACIAARLLTT